MNRFVYHYHAEHRLPKTVTSVDGIALMRTPIRTMADYKILKSIIVSGLVPEIPAENLIVCSLTPLGREVEDPSIDYDSKGQI